MLLLPIVNLIKTIETDGKKEFRKVAGASSFADAEGDLKNPPAAYVIPLSDTAGANQLGGGAILQPVREQFGVALALSNLRDETGFASQLELERVRRLVIGKLLGFVPGTDYEPCELGPGRLLKVTKAVLWWQITFTTGYMERNF